MDVYFSSLPPVSSTMESLGKQLRWKRLSEGGYRLAGLFQFNTFVWIFLIEQDDLELVPEANYQSH
jgi:hypothetical protein